MKKMLLLLVLMFSMALVGCGQSNGLDKSRSSGADTSNTDIAEITPGRAKEIALAKVPGASEADIRNFETDYDDGRKIYEGKIVYDKTEYDFEIDAATGDIMKWESESVYD